MQAFNPYLPLDTYIPDGEPHIFGDRLYVFGSHDQEGGSAFCVLDYEAWSAPLDNLADWRCEGTIYRAKQDPTQDDNGKYRHMYAPDVVQGVDGRYYLYYALAGCAFTGPIHVAVCDTPAGKYEYYGEVRNPDGSTFDRCITFDPGLINDNGNIWLYYGWSISAPVLQKRGNFSKKIIDKLLMRSLEKKMFDKTDAQIDREPNGIQGANVVRLADDMLTVLEGPKRIVPGPMDAAGTSFEGHSFFEASSIRKIGDTYYFVYSSEYFHELCYATSHYPDRDFTFGGVLISSAELFRDPRLPRVQKYMTTNNHGSLVEVNGQWYIFYHRHTHKTQYSRQGCAEKIQLLPDGSFRQASVTSCGLNPGPLKCEGAYPAPIACHIFKGIVPNFTTSKPVKSFPHVTHKDSEHYIAQITNGTRLGYKYFDFTSPVTVTLTVRGNATGTLKISAGDNTAETVAIRPSDSWTKVAARIDAAGEQALWLDYSGKGELELLELSFA